MKQPLLALSAFLLVPGAAGQVANGSVLNCTIPSHNPKRVMDDFVTPLSAEETLGLKSAPHGARRVGQHQLEISWIGGTRIFKDKPPYDEPLGGTHWTYCGYNASVGLYMLLKAEEGLFTGALLDDKTGSVLPGGQKIVFSPDVQYYLAYEQPDGMDGEMIKLFRRDGLPIWEGYDGILTSDGKTVVANFENMRWDSQNRLQAEVRPKGQKPTTVTLTKLSDGKWDWLPHIPN